MFFLFFTAVFKNCFRSDQISWVGIKLLKEVRHVEVGINVYSPIIHGLSHGTNGAFVITRRDSVE